MKALVLYRSYYGNTKRVADSIVEQFKAAGHEASALDLRLKLPDTKDLDIVFIGAPTRFGGVTGKAIGGIRHLKKKGFAGRLAIFDTYAVLTGTPEEQEKSRRWVIPGAAGKMQQAAEKYGLNVHGKTLRCAVSDMKGPLAAGEIEKVADFVREVLEAAGKKA